MAPENAAAGQGDGLAATGYDAPTDFEALLTWEEVGALEAHNRGWTPSRRVVLAMLSSSRTALLDVVRDPADSVDAYLEMMEVVSNYRGQLDIWMEQAEMAEARIMSVLAALNARIEAAGPQRA